ncbi:C-C motif chemokine 3-like [Mugil cephalus]|uniref:C-C motif chemokine 3-like n=1 Tax=Mugil cephalus TaxID=48193 RepID=UPI001FB5A290|nr:C-C motif chemokine 3-like [Mugil cephalus]
MAKVVACVSILLVLLATLGESSPILCCTKYQPKAISLKVLKDYTIQTRDYCKLEAVIFTTIRGRYACGNPKDQWVQIAMEKLLGPRSGGSWSSLHRENRRQSTWRKPTPEYPEKTDARSTRRKPTPEYPETTHA